LRRYEERLRTLPPSGGGGCHPALLGCANAGVRAGRTPEQVREDLRRFVHGTRPVTDREIRDAVAKAMADRGISARPRTRHRIHTACAAPSFDAEKFMAERLREARGIGEVDVWEASPIRIDGPPERDAVRLLEHLYRPEDVLFLGGTYDRNVKRVGEWIADIENGMAAPPHAIPNPLTGRAGLTKDNRPSFRADSCVKSFRFAVAEFDGISREDQLRFWWAVRLPVCALIDSGGKSLHAWIRIDGIDGAAAWTQQVEENLFRHYLIPLGCDAACRNEARLSRLPGHYRKEKGRWQRLLYLAPEGRPIHAGA
jgi:hypothetical protein